MVQFYYIILLQFLSWVVTCLVWVQRQSHSWTLSVQSAQSIKPGVLLIQNHSDLHYSRWGLCHEFHWRKNLSPLRVASQPESLKILCYLRKFSAEGTALPDCLGNLLILHSLVLILTQGSFSFHFLSNLELKHCNYLSWYCQTLIFLYRILNLFLISYCASVFHWQTTLWFIHTNLTNCTLGVCYALLLNFGG